MNILKKYLPKFVLNILRACRSLLEYSFYCCYEIRKVVYLGISNREKMLSSIISTYHVIEKGLTMPERRLGFGKDKVLYLIRLCEEYASCYGDKDEQFLIAIGVLAEYRNLHLKEGFALDDEFYAVLNGFIERFAHIPQIEQHLFTREQYFACLQTSFDVFSFSRHSLRHYSGEVELEDLKKAIALAGNAPSACNRQSTRVKIIVDKEKVRAILEIQNGNRGFGYLADKLIVLTSSISAWSVRSRNGLYIDSGIFAMNLLYSLHFYKIGACTLNCYLTPKQNRRMRKILNLPPFEDIVLLIAVGGVPDSFAVTASHRSHPDNFTTIL